MKRPISIIMVTRGRPTAMKHAIDAVIDNCDDKSKIELFIKLDTDDAPSIEFCEKEMRRDIDVEVFVTDRGKGFYELHKPLDFLWPKTHGRMILPLSDDLICETPGWDTIVEKYVDHPYAILFPQHLHQGGNVCPIINKRLLELSGTIGKWTDVFWEFVQDNIPGGLFIKMDGVSAPSVVFHHRREHPPSWYVDGETWKGNDYDNVFWEGVGNAVLKVKEDMLLNPGPFIITHDNFVPGKPVPIVKVQTVSHEPVTGHIPTKG